MEEKTSWQAVVDAANQAAYLESVGLQTQAALKSGKACALLVEFIHRKAKIFEGYSLEVEG